MKKQVSLVSALLISAAMLTFSCNRKGCTDPTATNYDEDAKKDDDSCVYPEEEEDESEVVVTANITSNTTWTKDKIYILAGRITVESGATLTIEPGTIIKGQAGTGANATALLVARGGMLMADGTASEPIIFTSVADEIVQGQIESPNLDPDINGLWGGLLILGNAPISASNDNGDVTEVQIEGIPTSDPNGLYGGNDAADNSGSVSYVSIRHGGTNIGAGNEINGISLGGVGSGTTLDHIEIVGNQDDGIEFYGGTANMSNAVVWNNGDDAFDTDQSWAGTLDNFVLIGATGHVFELDGPEGSMAAGHTIRNGSVKAQFGSRISQDLINWDDNSMVDLENIYFTEIDIDAQTQAINDLANSPDVSLTNIILNVPTDSLPNHYEGATVPNSITSGTTGQADVSGLGWTWAGTAGGFSGL